MEQEIALKGGRTTAGVVRIGDTAGRPPGISNDDLPVASQAQRVADFFRHYGLGTDTAIPSIIAAQSTLAARANKTT